MENGPKGSPDVVLAALLLVVLVAVGVYEVVAVYSGGRLGTVSEVVVRWSRQMPLLPLVVGLILGHLFFPGPR